MVNIDNGFGAAQMAHRILQRLKGNSGASGWRKILVRLAYFDCPTGASGDMILAALLDAGLPEPALREGLQALHLDTFELAVRKVTKSGFSATQVQVTVHKDSPARRLAEIEAILRSSALDTPVLQKAEKMFTRLAMVEAAIHGKDISAVHLHELSGDDTIVDVTGVLLGFQLRALGVTNSAEAIRIAVEAGIPPKNRRSGAND